MLYSRFYCKQNNKNITEVNVNATSYFKKEFFSPYVHLFVVESTDILVLSCNSSLLQS